jgi:hypothetical protein
VDSPDCITIQDNHSLNKTWKNGMALKPGVLYGLEDGDVVAMGEVKVKFVRNCGEEEEEEQRLKCPEKLKQESPEASKSPTTPVNNTFHVPETPVAAAKKSMLFDFVPQSQSSPAPVPESPSLGDRSGSCLDDSSFLAPSQPPPPASPSRTKRTLHKTGDWRATKEADSLDIYDVATQRVEAVQVTASSSSSIYAAETQKVVTEGDGSKKCIYEAETQPFDGGKDNTSHDKTRKHEEKSIFEEETQVICVTSRDEMESGRKESTSNGENIVDAVRPGDSPKKDTESNANDKMAKTHSDSNIEDGTTGNVENQILGGDDRMKMDEEDVTQLIVPVSFAEEESAEEEFASAETQPFVAVPGISPSHPVDDDEDLFLQHSNEDQNKEQDEIKEDVDNQEDESNISEDLLADTPSETTSFSSPVRPSSPTPGIGKESRDNSLTPVGTDPNNVTEDLEDTIIIESSVDKTGNTEITYDCRNKGTNVEEGGIISLSGEITNGAESDDDDVIPSSQDSGIIGRTNFHSMSMELTNTNPNSSRQSVAEENVTVAKVASSIRPRGVQAVQQHTSSDNGPGGNEEEGSRSTSISSAKEKITSPPGRRAKIIVRQSKSPPDSIDDLDMTTGRSESDVPEEADTREAELTQYVQEVREIPTVSGSDQVSLNTSIIERVGSGDEDDELCITEPDSEPLVLPSTQVFETAHDTKLVETEAPEDLSSDDDRHNLVIDESAGEKGTSGKSNTSLSSSKRSSGNRQRRSSSKVRKVPAKMKSVAQSDRGSALLKRTAERRSEKSLPLQNTASPIPARRSGRATKRPAKLLDEDSETGQSLPSTSAGEKSTKKEKVQSSIITVDEAVAFPDEAPVEAIEEVNSSTTSGEADARLDKQKTATASDNDGKTQSLQTPTTIKANGRKATLQKQNHKEIRNAAPIRRSRKQQENSNKTFGIEETGSKVSRPSSSTKVPSETNSDTAMPSGGNRRSSQRKDVKDSTGTCGLEERISPKKSYTDRHKSVEHLPWENHTSTSKFRKGQLGSNHRASNGKGSDKDVDVLPEKAKPSPGKRPKRTTQSKSTGILANAEISVVLPNGAAALQTRRSSARQKNSTTATSTTGKKRKTPPPKRVSPATGAASVKTAVVKMEVDDVTEESKTKQRMSTAAVKTSVRASLVETGKAVATIASARGASRRRTRATDQDSEMEQQVTPAAAEKNKRSTLSAPVAPKRRRRTLARVYSFFPFLEVRATKFFFS